ncbi:MAG: AraC family transcriptional regulator [Ignavibacteriae bacterium]|nr:MAG: AraC family transcriptional regulator [Ignavibacteriota bacterium]
MKLKVINNFPDPFHPKFSFKEWDKQFVSHNAVLNGYYSNIYYPEHWTTLSIKCAFNGVEYYIKDNIKYGVDDNSYLILNNGTMYESYIRSENKVESFTVNFTKEFTEEVFNSLNNKDSFLLDYPEVKDREPVNFFEKLYQHNPLILKLLNDIRKTIQTPGYDNVLLNEKLHMMLNVLFCIQLNTFKDADSVNAVKKSTRMELYRRLNIAKDYIYSNYYDNVTLDELSKVSCLSQHHLLRKFKTQFGITPHQYLTKRRMEAAKVLIEKTNFSISEICFSVGFEDLSSFGELFKKHYSFSPENYRKSYSSKKAILT